MSSSFATKGEDNGSEAHRADMGDPQGHANTKGHEPHLYSVQPRGSRERFKQRTPAFKVFPLLPFFPTGSHCFSVYIFNLQTSNGNTRGT